MMNPDLIQELPKLNYCEQGNKIFVKPGVYPLSSRKLEGFMKIANLQKYYQCNPVRFINDFFNIELLDAQAWVIQRAWNCPNVLLVCTRGFGKSTLIDIMIMAKDMLFNNYWTYIASGSGSQAEQTFTTLERLANDNIDTMLGSTGYIFKAEIEIKNAAGDGFSHSSNGFSYSLYNGSFTQTLNSNVDKKRGMRGSVVFDECGFLDEEMMSVYAAFAIVNKSFTGQVTKTFTDISGNTVTLTGNIDKFNDSLRVTQSLVSKSGSGMSSFGNSIKGMVSGNFKGAIADIASYVSYFQVTMKAIQQAKQGFNDFLNFQKDLTNISYTMNLSPDQLQNLGTSAIDMAKDLSMSLDNTMDIYKIYANMNTKSMLDAFTDSMSLAEEATTANGNAEANQEKYMESTAGKLQAIKTQMQDFWVNFYNSGTVNGVLEFVHSLTEGFTSLEKTLGPIPALLTAVFAAMTVKNATMAGLKFLSGGGLATVVG